MPATDSIKIEWSGELDIVAKLTTYPKEMAKAVKRGVLVAARHLASLMRTFLQVRRTGTLYRSLGEKVKRKLDASSTYALAGPRRGVVAYWKGDAGQARKTAKRITKRQRTDSEFMARFSKKAGGQAAGRLIKPTKYSHLVERGGKRMPRFPFVRPAVASGSAQAREIILQHAREAVGK